MRERDGHHPAVDKLRCRDHLRPPRDESLGLEPVGLAGPLLLQHEDQMAAPPERFDLGPVMLLESIGRNDAPAARLREAADPVDILRVAEKLVVDVDDVIDIAGTFGKRLQAASVVRREIRIEEEL